MEMGASSRQRVWISMWIWTEVIRRNHYAGLQSALSPTIGIVETYVHELLVGH